MYINVFQYSNNIHESNQLLTLFAYFRALRLSGRSRLEGLKHVIITVKALPPNESFSILVIFESLLQIVIITLYCMYMQYSVPVRDMS